MTPACSSLRTRSQHGELDSPTAWPISCRLARAFFCRTVRILRSKASTPEIIGEPENLPKVLPGRLALEARTARISAAGATHWSLGRRAYRQRRAQPGPGGLSPAGRVGCLKPLAGRRTRAGGCARAAAAPPRGWQ